jgi:hypothetical protein
MKRLLNGQYTKDAADAVMANANSVLKLNLQEGYDSLFHIKNVKKQQIKRIHLNKRSLI